MAQALYSQRYHFLSSFTNEPNRLMLQYTRLERVPKGKHSSLLGSYVSSKENEVM
jgi:hypothetical protein